MVATLLALSGCTFEQKARMVLEPVRVDHFYTTSYSGELRSKYEAAFRDPVRKGGVSFGLSGAPPRVSRFRRGERVCVAIHSLPGERYLYQVVGRDSKPHSRWVSGYGYPQVLHTPVRFWELNVGGEREGWRATCIWNAVDTMTLDGWKNYYRNPRQWVWVDTLAPGSYTVRLKIKERDTERNISLDTSFSVE